MHLHWHTITCRTYVGRLHKIAVKQTTITTTPSVIMDVSAEDLGTDGAADDNSQS